MNSKQDTSSYRQILKATSIFGGVQIITVVISIFRSKVIAIFLGPAGIGIHSILISAAGFVAGLTNFGLATSAVKSVSEANSNSDSYKTERVIIVLKRLTIISGFLGLLTTFFLSPLLSKFAFGNYDYVIYFRIISVTLLLNQISNGNLAILQGLRQLNYLAWSGISGAAIGLIISVPIYYFWEIEGIVPAIVLSSIVNLLRTWYYTNKVKIKHTYVTWKSTISDAREMLSMGFMLSLSGLFLLAKDYGFRSLISNIGGIGEVGLYSAGFTILNSYVGMIFTAMSTDYFPRLTQIASNNTKVIKLVNQQSEIAVLILGPIISLFIVYISWIVLILYSKDFVSINRMIQFAIFGIYFKATSWSMSYVLLAKGSSKLYVSNEIIGGSITFVINMLGYYIGGLKGMGIGFTIGYLYYMAQIYFVLKYKMNFKIAKEFVQILIIQVTFSLGALMVINDMPGIYGYIVGTVITILSVIFSFYELNKRLNLRDLISNFRKG